VRVTVQFYARLRDLAGCAETAIDVPDGSTIDDVWQAAAARHPAVAPFAASVSCARNDDFARRSTPVAAGDVIAFLPPVSGGRC
jgi:molybdopterin converting factor subunit 1